jgi:hypothetical protein
MSDLSYFGKALVKLEGGPYPGLDHEIDLEPDGSMPGEITIRQLHALGPAGPEWTVHRYLQTNGVRYKYAGAQ